MFYRQKHHHMETALGPCLGTIPYAAFFFPQQCYLAVLYFQHSYNFGKVSPSNSGNLCTQNFPWKMQEECDLNNVSQND